MLQIHNALSRSGVLTLDDIDYSKSVPKVKKELELDAAEIWSSYFELLFGSVSLPDQIVGCKTLIDKHLPNLSKKLFARNEICKSFLLELLIGDPRDTVKQVQDVLSGDSTEADAIKKEKTAIRAAFGYDTVSKKSAFAELIKLLDVNVCPYCGRMFTTTVKKSSSGFIRANQVDHFFPKALYPYLAVSIWNWIPSCGPCNNRKSDNATKQFLYPYSEGMGDDYRFTTHIKGDIGYLVGKNGSHDDFWLSIEPTAACLEDPSKESFRDRANYELEKLGADALYTSHKSYVCDIFRQRYVFGDAYIESLVSSFPELFKSRADVQALLYMKRIEAESIGKTPLDKLTRDIDHEIDTLLYHT